jgi:hypothetical protein
MNLMLYIELTKKEAELFKTIDIQIRKIIKSCMKR